MVKIELEYLCREIRWGIRNNRYGEVNWSELL